MLLFAISGATALLLGGSLLFGLFLLGAALKYRLNKEIAEKTRAFNRAKYAEKDVFTLRPVLLKMGLVTALALSFIAISWTVYQPQLPTYESAEYGETDLLVVPPIMREKPPPPPPPVEIEAVEDHLILEDTTVFTSRDMQANQAVIPPAIITKKPLPPPPPPPPPVVTDIPVCTFAEEMPYYGECTAPDSRKQCSDKAIIGFIAGEANYPRLAKENDITGTAVVRFIVEKDGSMTDVEIVRDPGGGLGAEALRVVQIMAANDQKWHPGRQNGRFVRVMMTLPVKFQLN